MAKRTPIYDEHVKLNAKIVEFAGWEMPLLYTGVIEEHEAVRTKVGLFDVSHMGEIEIKGPDALNLAQYLTTNDLSKLENGQAIYSLLCNENGTIVDDIIAYRFSEEHILFVVNASNISKDFQWLTSHRKGRAEIADSSDKYALMALQGQEAAQVLKRLTTADVDSLKTFHFTYAPVAGKDDCVIARTGYTGEDGFEIFTPPAAAAEVWRSILKEGAEFGIKPCGLGARDTLRLEMKYSLYGHEITERTNPFEAGLSRVVKIDKGSDFLGREALIKIKERGLKRKLVGFVMLEPGIPRENHAIVINKRPVGFVTSGTMSPSLKKAIGIGYVPIDFASPGTKILIDIRGKERLAEVVETPFYKREK